MTTRLTSYTSQVIEHGFRWSDMQPGVLYLRLPEPDPTDGMAGLLCPCPCRKQLIVYFADMPQIWAPAQYPDGSYGLMPSLNLGEGCRSHFTLSHGQIQWSN